MSVELPEELPEGWVETTLDALASVNWGNTSITKKKYRKTGYQAYSAAGGDGLLEDFEHDGEGIILSAIGARCGRCFRADGKWTAIKNTITITQLDVNIDFLFHYLNNAERWPRSGGAQPFIPLGKAKNIRLSIPPSMSRGGLRTSWMLCWGRWRAARPASTKPKPSSNASANPS